MFGHLGVHAFGQVGQRVRLLEAGARPLALEQLRYGLLHHFQLLDAVGRFLPVRLGGEW